ncbi:MAG: LacI family DNA-binding transcriptional regulator [Anaerolineae bacterium]|nr:LacI family DNA-binding transcriptional regulator [Anaerolineae bacterium]
MKSTSNLALAQAFVNVSGNVYNYCAIELLACQTCLDIRDVAARAGVSYQTVSRVLNDRPDVAEETRQHVKQVITELEYRPNRAAKSLAGRESRVLGAIVQGFNYFGPAQLVAEAEHAASEAGYDLLVDSVCDGSVDQLGAAIDQMDGWSVDGILINVVVPHTLLSRISHIPIVQTEIRASDDNVTAVYVDQAHAIRQAVEHLIDIGHTVIGEISGPLNWFGARVRHHTWQTTLEQHGFRLGPHSESNWTVDGGYQAAMQLLATGKPFTALVIGNDEMAIGAIHALQDQGFNVPGDVSVVGMDDIPLAAHMRPPLTTVRQDFRFFGSEAIRYLLELIKAPDSEPEQRAVLPELIIRESTAPPP